MENQLNQIKMSVLLSKQAAKQAEDKKNEIIMYLAHDIRTPLTTVIGYLSLLHEAPDMPEEQKEKYIKVALDKAGRLEKLLDTLTGANATLLAYANKKIEDLDNRRKTLSKAIADLSVETLSSQQIELLSGYLDDWENISFEDKRKAADGLISSISATSDYVKIEWKICPLFRSIKPLVSLYRL